MKLIAKKGSTKHLKRLGIDFEVDEKECTSNGCVLPGGFYHVEFKELGLTTALPVNLLEIIG